MVMKKELTEEMSRCKKAHREIRGNPHAMAVNLKTFFKSFSIIFALQMFEWLNCGCEEDWVNRIWKVLGDNEKIC
jgi:hypothetical protein